MQTTDKQNSKRKRLLATPGVTKVARVNGRVVYYGLDLVTGKPFVRSVKARTSTSIKKRGDLFSSPTLPDSLSAAFKDAVMAAQKRYG
jgi:hypothetical protein